MNISVLNRDFQVIYVLDTYESFLWTDRYFKEGEFEIYTTISKEIVDNLKPDFYLSIKDSERIMIIENLEIIADIEDANKIKITGRSIESILDRRIIWGKQTLKGKLENIIRSLINGNIVNPTNTDRAIPNFIYEDSGDESINTIDVDEQYEGDDLLSIISSLCEKNEIGFKVTLDNSDRFVFKLFKGIDRSYSQDVLPWVVFRPDFDNVVTSNYIEEKSDYKTITLIVGSETIRTEREEDGRTITETEEQEVTRTIGSGTGLDRREIYTRSSARRDEDMSHDEFIAQMDREGSDTLKEHKIKKSFDGEFETTRMFVYGRDFFIGDVVQVANEYGMEASSRVTEFIYSHDSSGLRSYPTFTAKDYPEQ